MHPVADIVQRKSRGLTSWRGLLLIAAITLALSQLAPSRSVSRPEAASQPDCAAWDRAASEGIATIISDNRAASELRLDEALLQLRRARKNCRAGWVELAGHDYTSLHRTYPVATGSVRAIARDSASDAAAPVPPQR
jgi:hypothetical protein